MWITSRFISVWRGQETSLIWARVSIKKINRSVSVIPSDQIYDLFEVIHRKDEEDIGNLINDLYKEFLDQSAIENKNVDSDYSPINIAPKQKAMLFQLQYQLMLWYEILNLISTLKTSMFHLKFWNLQRRMNNGSKENNSKR